MQNRIIQKKSLNYIFEIVNYLYFSLELDQAIEVVKLRKEPNKDMFAAALDFIIDRNLTFLGAFSIRYTDETRTAIKKIPHFLAKEVEGVRMDKHLMPFDFKLSKDKKPLVVGEKYIKLFDYGNS